jgi:cytochrome oxidase Cu insertion factor (SCO1/SenC/PrrC family)
MTKLNLHRVATTLANRYVQVLAWLAVLLAAILILASILGWLTGAFDGPQNALNNTRLPYYFQMNLQPRWDKWASWQRVSDFSLVSQHAQPVNETLFQAKPSFVGFFYAGCVTLCPISLEVLRELQSQLASKVIAIPQFVMLTVTPEQDDAKSMAVYSQRLKLPENCLMLSGQRKQMQKFTNSLMTDIQTRSINGEPLHGQRAFLLDNKARVRGIYDASSMIEIRRMVRDYERLLENEY